MHAIRRRRRDQRFAGVAAGWIVLLLASLGPSPLVGQAAKPDEPDLSRSLRGTLVSALAILGGDADVSARARELEAEARGGEPVDA